VLFQGEYGIEDVAMSLPVVVGRSGIERVLTPALTAEEKRLLEGSARQLKSVLGGVR
jgi:L-lactate dehydrogenase